MKVKDIIQYTEWLPNPNTLDEKPLFSIWMPTFHRNKSGHLKRAIESVLNQTFKNFELIIVDDASVDGSFGQIKQFMNKDPRIHCLRHPKNVGLPAISCYEAYLKSRADYFMFCFDDAEYSIDALEKTQEYISQNKIKIAFGYITWKNKTINAQEDILMLGKEFISQQNLSISNFLPNLGVVIHREVVNEIGFLDPHPAVARVTDWDYWKRAARSYEIHRMNILIGSEYGLVTGNSLGLTYPLNSWISYEWTEIERNESLKPDKYEEYDVETIPLELSYSAQLALKDLISFYSSKFWFSERNEIGKAKFLDNISYGKILVLVPEISASISLPFENLAGCYFRFAMINDHRGNNIVLDLKDIFNAQAIVICRNLMSPAEKFVIGLAKKLKIPLYYYLDDNFILLSREIKDLGKYTEKNLKKVLEGFSGVLVPNKKLAEFFIERELHSKVYVFPPVKPSRPWFDYSSIPSKPKDSLRIGFMGGSHRHKHFFKYVLPAINKIATEKKVELIITGDIEISEKDCPGIPIYHFPFDISYHLTVGRMSSCEIDILVHSGTDTDNNLYKTPNVLLNAWILGAIPVLANQPPYEFVEQNGLGLLCVFDDPDSWREKLEFVISDFNGMLKIKKKLEEFVGLEYSGMQNINVIRSILSEGSPIGYATIESRFRYYIDLLQKDNKLKLMPYLMSQVVALSAVKLWSKLRYRLTVENSNWTGFQFVIGTFEKSVRGILRIEIKDINAKVSIRVVELGLDNIFDNQTVLVEFDFIPESEGKQYELIFTYHKHDNSNSDSIAIYETNPPENIIRKILRRLHLLTYGNKIACNLIYIDDNEI